jgi:hypothetical protein
LIPTLMSFTLPAGFRFLLAHEAERLSQGQTIVLFNGELCHGTVKSFGDATMTVTLRSGAVVTLDLDDPDYWPDDESRERRPPMDAAGEFVAIREVLATPDADIEPLMRTSVGLERLAKDDPELKAAIAEVRRILIDRLKGKAA